MCGIAGIWGNPQPERLQAMARHLAHRGPDGAGSWFDEDSDLGLTHRRLAVIDVARGHQPMTDAAGAGVIVLNGAIYNHRALRKSLATTRPFRTESDTEVVLQAYLELGPAMLERLRGMFALALWDVARRELFLCRDPLGQKPLFFHQGPQRFVFASEIGAIRAAMDQDFPVDPQGVGEFLGWGAILPPRTIFRGIESVGPGEWIIVRDRQIAERQRYWHPRSRLEASDSQSHLRGHEVGDIETLLRRSVALHLESDVPVACFLSGGVDSGLVTAMASVSHSGPLRTITVGFDDPAWDERSAARAVATHLRTEHHEVLVRPNVAADLPRILASYGQPFGDPSAVAAHYLAQAAAGLAKVVLLGDGGDEVFAGYRRYLAARWLGRLGPLDAAPTRKAARWLLDRLPTPPSFRSRYGWGHRWLRGFSKEPAPRYLAWTLDGFGGDELAKWAARAGVDTHHCYVAERHAQEILAEISEEDPVARMQLADLTSFLPGEFLVKTDTATMAAGLEARCPLLDRVLVEACLQQSGERRLSGLVTKPILRRVARRYLPAAIVDAPKRGFEIPLASWLRTDLASLCRDVILDRNTVLDDIASRSDRESLLFDPPRPDLHGWSRRIWLLLCLGLWDHTQKTKP